MTWQWHLDCYYNDIYFYKTQLLFNLFFPRPYICFHDEAAQQDLYK